jgi:hypothetical protein
MQIYPQIIDYNEAIQNPATAFIDPELQQAQTKENAIGLPLVLSGGFALTYMLIGAKRKIAVRCFHRQIPAVEDKYAAISQTFRNLNSPYFVGFEFLAHGIRVRQQVYPVVKMDWADGEILGLWLERNHADRAMLSRARGEFATLAQYLEDQGISHGDIQNGNLIVSPRGIKLIDYDGVYVPGMPLGDGSESGHKHFQHPDRNARQHGPGIDRFSFLALDLSLAALIEDPSLYRRYREGGETILFRANDFADPSHSEVFRALAEMPALASATQRFAAICRAPIDAVPTLRAFLAARDAPQTATVAATTAIRLRSAGYIGAYPVLSAADFAAVMKHVGHRVELVGRLASVEDGVGKGGRRHGRPYLQVNFSRHWRNVVRLIIWSDAAGSPSAPVGDWVGRWVSVVGLIDPPFVSDAFLVPRTEVGITLDDPSQVNFISAKQAKYRLAQPNDVSRAEERQIAPSPGGFAGASNGSLPLLNRQIVAQVLTSNRYASVAAPVPRRVATAVPPTSSPNANVNILRRLGSPAPVPGRLRGSGTGTFIGRVIRPLIGAIVWGIVAIGMYALLRAFGFVAGPFDPASEFGSVIAALFGAIGGAIEGAGFSGLAVFVPSAEGQEGLIFLVAALLRLTEIVALLAVTAAAVQILTAVVRARP